MTLSPGESLFVLTVGSLSSMYFGDVLRGGLVCYPRIELYYLANRILLLGMY